MKQTRKKLGEYWDSVFIKVIHPNLKFKRVEEEVKEHFNFAGLMIKRTLLPLIVLYIIFGFLFNINIFGSLFLSIIIFFYSNFLPDIDFLVKTTNQSSKESVWYDKYLLLFFAPIIVYYILAKRAKPIYSLQTRCFHNLKSLFIYTAFLIIVGHIFWNENIKIIIFVICGISGYSFHLIVDEIIIGSRWIKEKVKRKIKTRD